MSTRINFIICLLIGIPSFLIGESCDRYYSGLSNRLAVASFNYPFEYRNSLRCEYKIFLDRDNSIPENTVCYTFHRFALEECDDEDNSAPDNLSFYGTHTYCGHGNRLDDQNNDDKDTIWPQHFCWDVAASSMTMLFSSDDKYTNKGFYATFFTGRTTPAVHQIANNQSHIRTAPCQSNEQVCFSDRKCISELEVCESELQPRCDDRSDQSYAHAGCWPGQWGNMYACDFDQRNIYLCQFTVSMASGWHLDTISNDAHYGPIHDHTNPSEGVYIRTVFTWNGPNAVKLYLHTDLSSGATYCLSFWYHMRGHDPGSLRVKWGNTLPAWSRVGNLGSEWLHGQLERTIGPFDPTMITFEADRGGHIDSQIAIDDVSVLKGTCVNLEDISCNFEIGSCSWKTDSEIFIGTYSPSPDYVPVGDHSSGGDGSYAYINPYSGVQTASLTSDFITSPDHAHCFSFYAFTYGHNDRANIEVSQIDHEGKEKFYETFTINGAWQRVQWDLPKRTLPYKVKIEIRKYSDLETVGIDTISIVKSSLCKDIDQGTCEYNEFRCLVIKECIPNYLVCNGYKECVDGSDEQDCEGCAHDEFQCPDGLCISEDDLCNGYDDCYGGADEANCNSSGSSTSMPSVAIASLITASFLLITLLTVKLLNIYFRRRHLQTQRDAGRRRRRRPSNSMTRTRDSCNSDSGPELEQSPPDYWTCIQDTNYTRPSPEILLGGSRSENQKEVQPPPSYNAILTDQYVTITTPVASELKRMRHEMAKREGWEILSEGADMEGDLVNKAPERGNLVGTAAVAGPSFGITQGAAARGHNVDKQSRHHRHTPKRRSSGGRPSENGRRRGSTYSDRGGFTDISRMRLQRPVEGGAHNLAFSTEEQLPIDTYRLTHEPPIRPRPLSVSTEDHQRPAACSSFDENDLHVLPSFSMSSLASSINVRGDISSYVIDEELDNELNTAAANQRDVLHVNTPQERETNAN